MMMNAMGMTNVGHRWRCHLESLDGASTEIAGVITPSPYRNAPPKRPSADEHPFDGAIHLAMCRWRMSASRASTPTSRGCPARRMNATYFTLTISTSDPENQRQQPVDVCRRSA
jgi:hypothetical protein